MTDLGPRLNLKDNVRVAVLRQPSGVTLDLSPGVQVPSAADAAAVLVFATMLADLETPEVQVAVEAGLADRVAWIAYPKARKLGTDLNRDILWRAILPRGVRPVRQVSIDETWSAIRLRPGTTAPPGG